MNTFRRISFMILLFAFFSTLSGQSITRLVFFNLKHEAGTPEADSFFEKSWVLKEVPSVKEFGMLKINLS